MSDRTQNEPGLWCKGCAVNQRPDKRGNCPRCGRHLTAFPSHFNKAEEVRNA
jgi:hypothetical protein